MPYLTYEEYSRFGFNSVEPSEFDRLLRRASDVIDFLTQYFYQYNDLELDNTFRKQQFKKAVACQIEYFKDVGGTSSHNINMPLTVNMGRTQVSTGVENQRKMNGLVAPDVLMYLEDTGLLYRGIGVIG